MRAKCGSLTLIELAAEIGASWTARAPPRRTAILMVEAAGVVPTGD